MYAGPVAGELLVCHFRITLPCFKELMVEVNVVLLRLFQFTGGDQGVHKQSVELVRRVETVGLALAGSM